MISLLDKGARAEGGWETSPYRGIVYEGARATCVVPLANSPSQKSQSRLGVAGRLLHVQAVSSIRHLIVDGANIVHAWPELRGLAKREHSAARTKLGQLLVHIHDDSELRVTLVFDGRGNEIVIDRPSEQTTFSVVYTPSTLTADDVIEHMVAHSSTPTECCVATDDNAERETVAALGAVTMRSEDLAEWVKRAQSHQASALEKLRNANSRTWKKS